MEALFVNAAYFDFGFFCCRPSISTMCDTFLVLEHLMNHDLACLVSMHVQLSGRNKTKALEGRYRRNVEYLSRNTLYFTDLMMDTKPRDTRTPNGLLKWALDSKEYLPTRCHAPAGTRIYPVYQLHSSGLRNRDNLPPDWHHKLEYTEITNTPPFPPVPWHKVLTIPRAYEMLFEVKEAWGAYDDCM